MSQLAAYRGLLGLIFFLLIAYLLSTNKKKINYKQVFIGLLLQFILALIITKLPIIETIFKTLTNLVNALQDSMLNGAQFVVGYLAGGEAPFNPVHPQASFILAIRALPMIIFLSAITSLLFYWRILPWIIHAFSVIFKKSLNIGGALGVGAASNIFLGFDISPMTIRPYLETMSRSEIFAFMTVGMANVAGTVMIVYATVLHGLIDNVIGHIIAASIINVPAAITIARIMEPQTTAHTHGTLYIPNKSSSSMDAIAQGTIDGTKVFINVIAMLFVLVGLVHLINQILGLIQIHHQPLSLQNILGTIFAPITWLMGIPWKEAHLAGLLIGTKTALNEIYAYVALAKDIHQNILDPKTRMILIYGLCGFANFGSIGIIIGVLGTLVPSRRELFVKLSVKAIVSGTIATLMTGTLIGLIY